MIGNLIYFCLGWLVGMGATFIALALCQAAARGDAPDAPRPDRQRERG